jgi:phage-related tail protein
MIVGVQGTSSFNDYQVFLRAMGVALSSMPVDDEYFYIYSAGPANVNKMVMEFTNVSEKGMKSRGKKIKMFKVAPSWITENISDFNYFAYLAKPKEGNSKLVAQAQLNNVEVGIFKY